MERNEALEAYQKKTYNHIVGTYIFTVEVAGVTTDEIAELKAKKSGINLHFLRYGVFHKKPLNYLEENILIESYDSENDVATSVDEDQGEELNTVEINAENKHLKPNDKLPNIEDVYYSRTQLNQGYLYVLEEEGEQFWLEYEVNAFGELLPVFWKDNIDTNNRYKNIRDKSSSKGEYSLTFSQCAIVWVGYSPTQLSFEQLETIKENPSNFECFQRIECEGFNRDEAANMDYYQQIAPYHRFYTHFKHDQSDESKVFKERLRSIATLEESDNSEENLLLEDMFITLLDPIGCADDLHELTQIENRWHEALIETLTIAQSPYNYYEYKWKGAKLNIEDVPKETKEQVSYLYATTLATYKFIYENSETQKDYSRNRDSWSHGVDKEKIFKILNVEGRKKQRERIYKMRNALGAFLKAELYQNALLVVYKDNIPVRQETGKLHTAEHLLTLVTYEGMADRDLNLVKDYKPKDDYWIQLVRDNLLGNSNSIKVTKLLFDLGVDIEEVENVPGKTLKTHFKFGKKFLSIGKKVTGIYAAISPLSESEFKIYLKHFSYLIVKNKKGLEGPFYKFHNKTFKDFLEGARLKGLRNSSNYHYTKTHSYYKVHPDVAKKAKKLANAKTKITDPIIYVDKVDRAKFGKTIEDFLGSKGFGRLLGVFELFGLGVAIYDISKDKEKGGGVNFKNTSSLGGAGIKTAALAMKLTENSNAADWVDIKARKYDLKVPRIINRAKHPERFIPVTYKGTAKAFGTAGGIITVLMCARDSYIAFAKADYDVAAAQAVAGVASGILLSSALGFAELSFTPAFIIGIIGLVALGVAYYFTDTKIEAYFKHYPLSTYSKINSGLYDLYPYDFMVKLYENRDSLLWPDVDNFLVKRSSENFKDFKQIFVDLMNMIAVCAIEISGSQSLHSPRDPQTVVYQTPKPYRDKWHHPWRSMGININFGAFLRDVNDLVYEVYYVLYDHIKGKGYSIPIPDRSIKLIPYTDPDTRLFMVQLWLQTPEKLTIVENESSRSIIEVATKRKTVHLDSQNGQIAALCKINNVHKEGFPLTKNNKQGYLYTQLPIQYRDAEGIVTRRSGFTQVVTKQQFLNTYPLKKIENA